jgi:hypothetical protein
MSGDGEKAAVVYSAELAEAKLVILNACPLQRQIEFNVARSLHPNVGRPERTQDRITG